MLSRILWTALVFRLLAFPNMGYSQHSGGSEKTLNRDVARLRHSPEDRDLRRRIIQFVDTMASKPMLPDSAATRLIRGNKIFRQVQDSAGYLDAANEFQEAVNIAPWFAKGYKNLAIAQEKAGLYSEAAQSLEFYVLAVPTLDDPSQVDTGQIRDKIIDLGLRAEQQAKTTKGKGKKKAPVQVPPTF